MTESVTTAAPAIEPGLIDAPGVAAFLSLSERSIWSMHASGRLPRPIKLPGMRAVRWRLQELRAWLDAGCPPRDRWEQGAKKILDKR